MSIHYIHYIRVTYLDKDNFVVHGEPTINLYGLLSQDGNDENNIIIALDEEYQGSTRLLYKWDTEHRLWQMIN